MNNNGVTNNANVQNQTQQPVVNNTPQQVSPSTVAQTTAPQQAAAQQPQIISHQPATPQTPTPAVGQPAPEKTYESLPSSTNSDINSNTSEKSGESSIDSMTEYVDEYSNEEPPKKKKSFTPILLIIIIGLIGYILYSNKNFNSKIESLKYNCTPVTSYKEAKELDLDSTLVKDLYSKVKTTIREDIAQPEWNDTMKLYLAYRQIPDSEKYESNCNMFDNSKMEPYICDESKSFTPKAFKASTLELELKKLYGEETYIELNNIKLSNSCIGGYQYIQERAEYVQGFCEQQTATSFKVEKTLKKAETYRNTIVLTENVKYHANEKMNLPEYLKSGDYIYTFRLDMNYNYVLISKIYDDKYN